MHAQTKTLQIEYIGVDSDDAFGTLSAVILGCLIEDDAMVFPVAIDYDDLLMMSKWSSHVSCRNCKKLAHVWLLSPSLLPSGLEHLF